MVLYELFSYNVGIQYKNTLCSKATFFVVITTIITILAPFILAYRSRGFWLKNYVFYEQPDVQFKYQYMFIAETDEIDYLIKCGNFPNASSMFLYEEECFHTMVQEDDFNQDNKIDEINFKLKVNNLSVKKILSIKGFLLFDYKLNDNCPLQMESMVHFDESFGMPCIKYFMTTTLDFTQSYPLRCWYNHKDVRYNHTVVPEVRDTNIAEWWDILLYDYSRRNVSTTIKNTYSTMKHGTGALFELVISVAIPEHAIRYKPGAWQELKFAWQQYLSIGVIFYWIMFKIKSYVFRNRIVSAWQNVPWKKYF